MNAVENHAPRFGFSISPGHPAGVAREVADAEAMGYERVGIWDSPTLFREPWVTLSAAAGATRRISLGTWVTNPVTREPVVTASAAATLDDLAPGRVYLGIGAGATGVWHLGLPAATMPQLEEYIVAVRALLEEGRARYDGRACPCSRPTSVTRRVSGRGACRSSASSTCSRPIRPASWGSTRARA